MFDTLELNQDALAEQLPRLDEARDLGLGIVRPHRFTGHAFSWNIVYGDDHQGEADWTLPDWVVSQAQSRGLAVLATLMAYANPNKPGDGGPPIIQAVPWGDKDAWAGFVGDVVERYDGDGVDDMPGLQIPVRDFEVGNDPGCTYGDMNCAEQYMAFRSLSPAALAAGVPAHVRRPRRRRATALTAPTDRPHVSRLVT